MDHRARRLTELVEQHYVLLYRYAYRLTGSQADAEDLTQQTFLTAQSKWEQLRDETRARSWLFTILRNAYLKQRRAPACRSSYGLEELAVPAEESADAQFDSEQLQNAVNDLPEEFRSPVILFYFQEFSYKEIAEHMQVPLGTVMSRLARAKAWLRQRLSSHDLATAAPIATDTELP